MRESREDSFSWNKNDDAYEHVERVLDIVSLFNILGVTHDAVMLRVFPITLTGATKRCVDKLSPGTINTWDLLKNAFIQRYCPPYKTAKQLEEIHKFKQEGDESLYQAWERYNDLLYKCPTYDLKIHQKVNIFYNGLDTMTRQLLDSHGPIPNKTPSQALTTIQTLADHSQKWHDESTIKRVSNDNLDRIATIKNKLDSLGRDMKKLKENVHAIQVGCENCPPGYYTRVDTRSPFSEKKLSLKELMNKHIKDSTRKREEMEEWMKKLQESIELNTRNQKSSLKNLDTQIEHLAKDYKAKAANEVPYLSVGYLNFYAMADLGASVNIMPRSMFNYLKLTNLKKINMLVEMADMTKRAPIGIVKNILVKIDRFVFPFDFVIIDMPGIGEDSNFFDMNGKAHHSTSPLEQNTQLCDTNNENLDSLSSFDNLQGPGDERKEMATILDSGPITLRWHIYKPIRVSCVNKCEKNYGLWPTCDPDLKHCNSGESVYGKGENGMITQWKCFRDNERQGVTGSNMVLTDFLQVRYGNQKIDDTTRERRYYE
ncbi:hypothetical protein Tco_1502919 [Tanacetum coccineum]